MPATSENRVFRGGNRGLSGGPPLKTRFWEVQYRISDFQIGPKKCWFSPLRMVQRGEKPHFEPPTGDRGSDIGGNFLKKWPKRGLHIGFHLKSPKIAKKCPKQGYPFFDQFFRKFPPISGPLSPVGGSKCGFSPLWAILRGGRTFWQNLKI